MKSLFLILAFTMFVNADYLYQGDNHCVIDLTPRNGGGWCYLDQTDNTSYCQKHSKLEDFINGYFYDGGNCQYKNDLSLSGLTQNQWDYMLALVAHFIGFTMLFMISFMSVLIARK